MQTITFLSVALRFCLNRICRVTSESYSTLKSRPHSASLRVDLFISLLSPQLCLRLRRTKGQKVNCEELAIVILIRKQWSVPELGDETGATYANQTTVHFQSTIQLRSAGRDQLVVCLLPLVPSRPRGRPALSGYHTGLYQCVVGSNPGLLLNKCDRLQTRRHYRFLFFPPRAFQVIHRSAIGSRNKKKRFQVETTFPLLQDSAK